MTSCRASGTDDAGRGPPQKSIDMPITIPTGGVVSAGVDHISVTREEAIDIVAAEGEYDMSNVDSPNKAQQKVLSDQTASRPLDLSM